MSDTYETTVGVEVHVELGTKTKMFCSCPNAPQEHQPNHACCPVCLGLPGSLPVINKEAVRLGIRAALALNCTINETIWFERKNYIYPDLVKGYQISQYVQPLGEWGWIAITGDDGREKKVVIRRLHLEEDTAKLTHVEGATHIDMNRSSTPLMEIVTEPVLKSGREAEEYVRKLRAILVYNGISRCRLQYGEMRVEANVSIAPKGSKTLGVRTEIKNQAGFNHMRSAVEYEARRHAQVLDSGGALTQQTMGWDDVRQETFAQRSKENAHDYRYFPDPDLPPARIEPAWVEKERNAMPAAYEKYVASLGEAGLSGADIDALSRNDALGFLRTAAEKSPDKTVLMAKRLIKDVFALSNSTNIPLDEAKITPDAFRDAVFLQESGTINAEGFRKALALLYSNGGAAEDIARAEDLIIEQNDDAARAAIVKVLSECASMAAEYKGGKTAVKNALFGRVMKELKKKGDPKAIGALLDEELNKL
ncbi:MAG: Asp-tRNA(Asn)/Glu-tRNA(Gln) amidotransferase subunit GatB [Planctomycetota bacterium]|jgi:aspartyl-tRNA(Asn)/glutamyl-tRNA(Gln) amidotransferase subunit B|nr:Asp-tRNA(Asn)/Glu-tRNA(Gln) amidotransferase subunit GatB [Planctomycetota bacterium]